MNKPASWKSREESLLLLNAYLDNELDAAAMLDVERRMSADATLKAEHDRLVELRAALAKNLKKDVASDALRRRIGAIVPTSEGSRELKPRSARTYDWRQMAAAAAIAAMLASGATYFGTSGGLSSGEIAGIVAGHQRALLAQTPFEVASSDRHTVKPWFDRKLALSPRIVDLASEGFPLAGGRVDHVGGKAVPTTVYMRREHVISVVALPKPGAMDSDDPPARGSRDGYTVFSWDGTDFRYAAVSDVAEDEFSEFVSIWRKASKQR
jgi:anti-sigma factor RsiW